MEIWDLYDKNRILTGKTIVRGEAIPEGYYHLAVHVWIRNSRGEYIISQRAADRPVYPLMWESVGGGVCSGEDTLTAALREVKEEIGVDLDPARGHVVFTRRRDIERGKVYRDITDVWLFEYDGDIDLSRATTREVLQSRWMTRAEIQKMYDAGDFIQSLDYFFTEVDK